MAAQSDRHVLYQDAVQDPEAEIDFVEETGGAVEVVDIEWQ